MSDFADSYTQYFGPGLRLYDGDLNAARTAQILPKIFRDVVQSPAISFRVQNITMATSDTLDIKPSQMGAASDNEITLCIVKVVGKIEVNTVGKDYDDATDVAGVSQSYGTSYFPGILIFSTYNLTSIEIEALAASEVTIYTSVQVPSTDARL